MSKKYISLVNQSDMTKAVTSGKTSICNTEEDAVITAELMRSYYFPAIETDEETGDEQTVYCVPK